MCVCERETKRERNGDCLGSHVYYVAVLVVLRTCDELVEREEKIQNSRWRMKDKKDMPHICFLF